MRVRLLGTLLLLPVIASAQRQAQTLPTSASISDVAYEVEFTRATAAQRILKVRMSMSVKGREPVLLSLPAWTPGAYELSWFARHVSAFAAEGDGRPLTWDKLDHDTWRVAANGAKQVTVHFDYRADSLDNAMAWSKPDFVFFNGTNVFLYPEGRASEYPARVSVRTEGEWKVATGMAGTPVGRTYAAPNYHELVDMPFFVGAFDLDSMKIQDRWVRLATYPAARFGGDDRKTLWDQLGRMIPPMSNLFGETPFDTYTNLLVFDDASEGASALEHSNSHVGVYSPFIIGNPYLPSITAHEIFHAWNVKRMRPVEMWPYRYDRAQPTPLLWVSEGITDYYADVVQLRGGIIDSAAFLELVQGKMEEVAAAPAVALEDASLSTWIHPPDGTGYIYYPKGSTAGFLLDVLIRDATDNTASLDDVMRDVYRSSYKQGKGFTTEDWWAAVSRATRGNPFSEFNARHIDGREPFPYTRVLALAGIRQRVDSIREPRIGVFTSQDSSGVVVTAVDSGSAAFAAGVREGDVLLSIGEVTVTEGFGERFRARHARSEGQVVQVRLKRQGREMSLPMRVLMAVRTEEKLMWDRNASAKALRVRQGLLRGR